MARPTKSTAAQSSHLTKEEKAKREIAERLAAGANDKLKPAKYLTPNQKKIFKFIIKSTEEANLLSNLDIYTLNTAVVTIDMLQQIDYTINLHPELAVDPKVSAARDRYFKQFARICNELSLSPQARAKFANQATMNMEQSKKISIMDILAAEDD